MKATNKATSKASNKKATAKKAPAKKAPAKKAPAAKAAKEKVSLATGPSKIDSPVLAMWNLCNDMQDSRRKDVIDAAVRKGISFYTARTQYQLWLVAYRNSK